MELAAVQRLMEATYGERDQGQETCHGGHGSPPDPVRDPAPVTGAPMIAEMRSARRRQARRLSASLATSPHACHMAWSWSSVIAVVENTGLSLRLMA